MSYKVLPTKEFSKDFKKLDETDRNSVQQKVEEVAIDPSRYKRLHYDLKGSSRVRVGKLRIIFSYDEERHELYLEKIVFHHNY